MAANACSSRTGSGGNRTSMQRSRPPPAPVPRRSSAGPVLIRHGGIYEHVVLLALPILGLLRCLELICNNKFGSGSPILIHVGPPIKQHLNSMRTFASTSCSLVKFAIRCSTEPLSCEGRIISLLVRVGLCGLFCSHLPLPHPVQPIEPQPHFLFRLWPACVLMLNSCGIPATPTL